MSKETVTKKTYHQIIIPASDIYQKAGDRIFNSFDRAKVSAQDANLLVIPKHIYESFKSSRRNDAYSHKISSVVSHLDNSFANNSHENSIIFGTESFPYTLLKYSDGLDILLLDQDKEDGELIDNINKNFSMKSNSLISYISSDPMMRTSKRNLPLSVEEPKFMIGDISILNKGTLAGSGSLYGALCSNSYKLDYDEFKEFFDNDSPIFPNTIVHFNAKDRYGLFEAPITRDNWGKISDVQSRDISLRLLNEEEYSKRIKIGDERLSSMHGIHPRDMLQYISVQYGLFNPDVSMLFLVGSAGSGKTLLSYAAGLTQVLEYPAAQLERFRWSNPFQQKGAKNVAEDLVNRLHKGDVARKEKSAAVYEKFILLKPDNAVGGREKGFLPGDLWSKISPDLKPYEDAHKLTSFNDKFSLKDLVLHPKFPNDYGGIRSAGASSAQIHKGRLPKSREALELTHLGTFRGRSFENTLMLIDEAQNYSPEEMRTIVSRIGVGSKLVIMGDPSLQVDNPRLSSNYNGLVQTIEKYLPKSYSMLVNLGHNYRSEISEDSISWRP